MPALASGTTSGMARQSIKIKAFLARGAHAGIQWLLEHPRGLITAGRK
jgi:hypothetical protein